MFIAGQTLSMVSPVGAECSDVTLLRSVERSQLVSYEHSAPQEQKTKTTLNNQKPGTGTMNQELRTKNQEPRTKNQEPRTKALLDFHSQLLFNILLINLCALFRRSRFVRHAVQFDYCPAPKLDVL